MEWTIQDLGAVGEFVGAIAVVVTLAYLAIQIRHGNADVRAATTQASLDAEMEFQAALIQHADTWETVVVSGDTSDQVATRRAIALYNMLMTLNDNRFQMTNSGYLEHPHEGVRRVVEMPFFDTWRPSPGAASRSKAFLDYVDEMRERETTN